MKSLRYTKARGRSLAKMALVRSLYHIILIRNMEWYFVQHGKLDPEKILKVKRKQ